MRERERERRDKTKENAAHEEVFFCLPLFLIFLLFFSKLKSEKAQCALLILFCFHFDKRKGRFRERRKKGEIERGDRQTTLPLLALFETEKKNSNPLSRFSSLSVRSTHSLSLSLFSLSHFPSLNHLSFFLSLHAGTGEGIPPELSFPPPSANDDGTPTAPSSSSSTV